MSVVVGVAENGRVTLGADSLVSTGWTIYEANPPKVFKHPCGMLFGVVGDARAWSVVRYKFVPPKQVDKDDLGYMASIVAIKLRDELRSHSVSDREAEDGDAPTEMLIGYNGHLYRFHADGYMHVLDGGYGAVGSGGEIALGAVAVAKGTAKVRLRQALEVSERHSMAVRRPFIFVAGTGKWALPTPKTEKVELGSDYLTAASDGG